MGLIGAIAFLIIYSKRSALMQQANGHYQAILDNHAICHWQIWCEVEPRVFRNMANHRGTYFEANSVGWWLAKERNFYSYFLRIGG